MIKTDSSNQVKVHLTCQLVMIINYSMTKVRNSRFISTLTILTHSCFLWSKYVTWREWNELVLSKIKYISLIFRKETTSLKKRNTLGILSKNSMLFSNPVQQRWTKSKILQEKYPLESMSRNWKWPILKQDGSLRRCLNIKWERKNKLYQTTTKCPNTKDRDTTDLHKVWEHPSRLGIVCIRVQVHKHSHRCSKVAVLVPSLLSGSLLQLTKR